MRRASISITIGSMLWVAASTAQALGFGRVSNSTVLGQPLNFEATVRLAPGEDVTPECVFADVYSGDNKLVAPLVRIQLDPGADGSERRLRVRTTSVIDEPVVTVLVTLGCDGSMTRKFVAFVDPPAIGLAESGVVGEPPTTGRAPSSAPAGQPRATASTDATGAGSAAAPAPSVTPRPAARSSRSVRTAPRRSTAVAAAPKPRRPRAQGVTAARPAAAPVARLQLEPAQALMPPSATASVPSTSGAATVSLDLPASGVQVAAAAVVADPAVDLLAKERARLQALEDSLTRVRDETQAAQRALATLQARVKEAESQRYANPLVYALAVVSALLALAVAVLWRRQARARNEAKWWGTVAPASAAVASTSPASAEEPTSQFADMPDEPELPKPVAKVIVAPESAKSPVWVDSRQTEPSPDLLPEPRRDLSVEELIDLEQQAEFFVVLGQDDAAIDLLMGHVRSTGGISPLPYLKLLEIYRRRGDRSAYERIRERFNRRFNAYAPDWDADLQQGRSLEDYPATIARLEALWVMPQRVMETLEASLFRRDETEEAFDLPAYRELLFLYAVARDFAHKAEDSNAVDLLLPMDTDAPSAPVSRLVASMPSILQGRSTGAPGTGGLALERDGTEPPSGSASGKPDAPDSTLGGGLSLDLEPHDPKNVAGDKNGGGIIRR